MNINLINLTKKQKQARNKICLVLDNIKTMDELEKIVKELSPFVGLFKIGKETFVRLGPNAVKLVQNNNANVFLDLKYHDIPNTIKGASCAATDLGVYMFNIHCAGGLEMMKAAVVGAKKTAEQNNLKRPKIIGVTLLTSIDDEILNKELLVKKQLNEYVLHLAKLSLKAGLDGIVCSANELSFLKPQLPRDFIFVTPGIKGVSTSAGEDQKRISSPREAINAGSSILVIGRAITNALNRKQEVYEIIKTIEEE